MTTSRAPRRWLEPTAAEATALAERHGTPLYAYDLSLMRERARALRTALPAKVLFGVKANPHPGVLSALRGELDGLDVASGGELTAALEGGWAGTWLSFAGPGKRADELALALAHEVVISVESVRELELLAGLARDQGTFARVRLRVNLAKTVHAYRVRMIGTPSPFGIDEEALPEAIAALREVGEAVRLEGLHVHPGGQCTSAGGVATAAALALDLVHHFSTLLREAVETVNLGGGFGVLAPGEELDVEATGQRLDAMLAKHERATGHRPQFIVEPGRWLAGPAGVYVARVVSEKVSRGTHFVVLDGGMNQHLGATGHLAPEGAPRLPVVNLSRPDGPRVRRTLVGPLCTPLDSFGEVELAEPRVGDLVGVLGSGAYGATFSPLRFLGHPPPAEVLLGRDGVDAEKRAPG